MWQYGSSCGLIVPNIPLYCVRGCAVISPGKITIRVVESASGRIEHLGGLCFAKGEQWLWCMGSRNRGGNRSASWICGSGRTHWLDWHRCTHDPQSGVAKAEQRAGLSLANAPFKERATRYTYHCCAKHFLSAVRTYHATDTTRRQCMFRSPFY